MKVLVTVKELFLSKSWSKFCSKYNVDSYSMCVGLLKPETEYKISLDEAREWGFLTKE